MALASYRDLCLDAVDPVVLGAFWAQVLDLELQVQGGGDAVLTGGTPRETIWVNRVTEPKTVKHRIHLDVNVASVAELLHVGATLVDDQTFPWTVMADPEGGEFCAFVREGEIIRRLYEIGIDTGEAGEPGAAPHRIAAWWAMVLGGMAVDDESGYTWVEQIPGAPFDSLDFVPVPEPKRGKNRIHLDVTTPDVSALVVAGAQVLRERDEEIAWTVLADPDGNEFCAFVG